MFEPEDSLHGFFQDLSQLKHEGNISAEYIWIDGSGINLRSKTKTLLNEVKSLKQIPELSIKGSPSLLALQEECDEVMLKPVAFFRDPFREGNDILVLCETYVWNNSFTELRPTNANFRYFAKEIFDAVKNEEIMFGIEQ